MKAFRFFLLLLLLLALGNNAVAQNLRSPQDGGRIPEGAVEIDIRDSLLKTTAGLFDNPLLLCAGNKDGSNAMTIGWISLGVHWFNPSLTVYVADKRHTRPFMDNNDYFTVMTFKNDDVLEYMGRHSGRDGDKAKALGLHVKYTDKGTPYYAEADMVIECRVMYSAQFKAENIKDPLVKGFYKAFRDGIHYEYVGRITKAWKNKH
ncbi:flavin reductase family protein [Prevotella falsenii]|uniref:flavin reductase family protein n=1 Tax=Prevotella falsenii TaxID=515414 RepID=UPI00046A9E67|nr:flavin reductase [Prevotella falsenii]